ncbi:MAG TPA: amino acid permease, partial [Planctomycetaceae bacterium]|nr:amino acid permease [Planctomycetaceae bacterium]
TLSSGFFLLPSFATQMAGPAVILAYFIAGLLLIPPMLSKIELGTAMPRSGGAYYFLDRSLGPMIGTIGGLGIWLALLLKTAFALVGMGAYMQLFLPESFGESMYTVIALGLVVFFGGLNILGAKKTIAFQIGLVFVLLLLLSWFLVAGSFTVRAVNFHGFFDSGFDSIFATAGLVFISYVGVTKVISVAGEIDNPERNLPLGLFLAIGIAITAGGCKTIVTRSHPPPPA